MEGKLHVILYFREECRRFGLRPSVAENIPMPEKHNEVRVDGAWRVRLKITRYAYGENDMDYGTLVILIVYW